MKFPMKSSLSAASLFGLAAAASWPYGPLTTSGSQMLDDVGNVVTYAGANWPGAADVMIPEGLQYQSVAKIVANLKETGINSIRLTFAIEMIDQIYENGGVDIPVATAFVNALGETNGSRVFQDMLLANPTFDKGITRLQVFDAIAAELYANEIYVHLDNHISKGMWCCSGDDGNSWWGDTYFDIDKWTRGLAYMAKHAKSWPAFTSIALRNEPRRPDNTTLADATYNWKYWYTYVRAGASAVSAANPDPLIFLSGLDYDTTLTPVVRKTALTPGNGTFSFADFPANKIVLELHKYGYQSVTDCASLESGLLRNGFEALDTNKPDVNHFPVVLTEWGFLMTDNTTWQKPYTQCLAQWLPAQKASWMIWVIAGSYYKRRASQDDEELWGLFNHDWSDWRNPTYIEQSFKPMVAATLS